LSEPPPIYVPPPRVNVDPRRQIADLQQLLDLRTRELEAVRRSAFRQGYLIGQAAKVRYTNWGGDA
jgi:hypothetical protein